jgi:hypothetical protein
MRDVFEIAGGTVAGRDHAAVGRNNQDAFAWHQDDRCTIAVVCDGCSEGPHSEVGAKLGARLLVRAIEERFWDYATNPYDATKPGSTIQRIEYCRARREPADIPEFWDEVGDHFLGSLGTLIPSLANLRVKGDRIVHDYFLFTVVGCLITQRFAYVFSVGDGVIAVNGDVEMLGPFPGNAPPYPMYAAMAPGTASADHSKFCLRPPIPLTVPFAVSHETAKGNRGCEGVQTILLGTDGVGDFIAAEQRTLPGKDEAVGPLAQFWTEDKYFRNPDMVRRRLTLINREVVHVEGGALEREPGLLPDDTTVVVVRRRKP